MKNIVFNIAILICNHVYADNIKCEDVKSEFRMFLNQLPNSCQSSANCTPLWIEECEDPFPISDKAKYYINNNKSYKRSFLKYVNEVSSYCDQKSYKKRVCNTFDATLVFCNRGHCDMHYQNNKY
jgi:hypothetical protein